MISRVSNLAKDSSRAILIVRFLEALENLSEAAEFRCFALRRGILTKYHVRDNFLCIRIRFS